MFGKRLINTGGEAVIPTSFNTVLYPTYSRAVTSIAGVGFQPDLVWIKDRNLTEPHVLFDSVRGAVSYLSSVTANASAAYTDGLTSFNSDGFTVGDDSGGFVNYTGRGPYVAWCWKAGGAAVTNTDGTITSDVSANVDAGFSVVKYTGNGISGATIGHGLSAVPAMTIVKNSSGSGFWIVWHNSFLYYQDVYFNGTDSVQSDYIHTASVTSSLFTVSSSSSANTSGDNYIAYCFAEKAGFSKFGSYTGNGSATGPTVTTGFEPAFVMIKRSDSTGNWVILDNKRDTSNPIDKTLNPNLTAAESTANDIDFNATTFQLKSTNADTNANTGTYIYIAFANQF